MDVWVIEGVEWSESDTGFSVESASVQRVDAESQTLVESLEPWEGPNIDMLGESETALCLAHWNYPQDTFTVFGVEKATGVVLWTHTNEGSGPDWWRVTENAIEYITTLAIYVKLSTDGQTVIESLQLPDLCRDFLTDPRSDGWIGLCGSGSGSGWDIVAIAEDGTTTALQRFAFPGYEFFGIDGLTVYQTHQVFRTDPIIPEKELIAFDLNSNEIETTPLKHTAFAVRAGYVYQSDSSTIVRQAL